MNSAEAVVYKFEAVDVLAARQVMRDKCLQDQASYYLLGVIRRGIITQPPPSISVDDQPAP